MAKKVYRVSIYTQRGTYLDFDAEYTRRADAKQSFMMRAAGRLAERDQCVLLSCGNVTMAAKSTDGHAVELSAAYFTE